jgi:hypothetical protein
MKYCRRCILPTRGPTSGSTPRACATPAAATLRVPTSTGSPAPRLQAAGRERPPKGKGYDCVIPVSGGKDSTWQVVTCLERG